MPMNQRSNGKHEHIISLGAEVLVEAEKAADAA